MKRVLMALLALALLLGHTVAFAAEADVLSGLQVAAENDQLALYINEENTRIAVENKEDGRVWKTWIDAGELSKKPNKKWTVTIGSMVMLDYAVVGNLTGDIISDNNAAMQCEIVRTDIENGISLRLSFPKIKIAFDLELTLEGNSLGLRIPDATIQEGETHVVMAITPFPFLGYTQDTNDGYYLYPNGSGQIYRFKAEELRKSSLSTYVMQYYSDSHLQLWKLGRDAWEMDLAELEAIIPAWGVVSDGSAMGALVEEGAVNASLSVVPSGSAIKANRIYNTFTYRKSFGTFGSEISVGGGTGHNLLGILNDRQRIEGDRAIRYFFLAGDAANYSGVACEVRDNLIGRGLLSGKTEGEIPLVLDLLCGVQEKKMLFTNMIAMTPFDKAAQMVEALHQDGVDRMMVTLLGWGNKGVFGSPINLPASGKLGGDQGVRSLAQVCNQMNAQLFLKADLVDIWGENGGFSMNADTARDINQYLYAFSSDGLDHYMAAPHTSLRWAQELIEKLQGWGVSGLYYDQIGDLVYDDYSKAHYARAAKAAELYGQMVQASMEGLGAAAVDGGNLYALRYAQRASDVPHAGDHMLLSDESVPFVQMVLHGSVVYTDLEMNGLYDPVGQRLKMIEYGYAPYYELTWENSNMIRNTDYNHLYSSEFSSWREDAVESYEIFCSALSGVWNEYMMKHEMLTRDVAAVTWSNGTVIYINYASEPWEQDGVRVEARSFTVVEGSAQ